jgi:5-carboxymethyl-2-hydroxymuconate isomerase
LPGKGFISVDVDTSRSEATLHIRLKIPAGRVVEVLKKVLEEVA